MKKFILFLTFIFTFAIVLTKTADASIVIDYAENQRPGYPTVKAAEKFADMVKTRTNGRVTVKIYADGKLSNEESVLKQLKFGVIDMTRISVPYLANNFGEFKVMQLPYLFNSEEHMHKVLEGEVGKYFLDIPKKDGIIALAWFDAGARNFYTTKKPIRNLEDFKQLKLRTQTSEVCTIMVSELGANPMPIPYGEVYGALQSGNVDGAENNFSSYVSMGHNEVAKYVTLTEHLYQPELIIMSKEALGELTPEDQKIVRESVLEMAKYEKVLWKEFEQKARDKAVSTGTTIIKLTPEELNKIKAALKKIENVYSPQQRRLIEKIRNTK